MSSPKRVTIVGEVDMGNADAVRANMLRALGDDLDADLMVDCSRLTFIDSSGLRALIEVQQFASALGKNFRLVDLSPGLFRKIELVGLAQLFGIRSESGADISGPQAV